MGIAISRSDRWGTWRCFCAYGKGTFAASAHYNGHANATIVSADFNGDGMTDLASTGYVTNDVSVFQGNGEGIFAAPVAFPVTAATYALATADFNRDGRRRAVRNPVVTIATGTSPGP